MQATQPTESELETSGSADAKAEDILANYFNADESETTQDDDKDDTPQAEQADGQPDSEDAEQAAPAESEGEQQESYTLAELADHLEIEPETLYAAEISMPDGTRIPVSNMKDEWQEAKKALADTKATSQQLQAYAQQLQQQQQVLAQQAGMMQLGPDEEEQQILQQLNAYAVAEQDQAYWDQQAKTDPGSTALALQRLQGLKGDLEKKLQAKQGERIQRSQQHQQELARLSYQEIGQRIPEWRDKAAEKADWSDITALWNRFGLPQNQIQGIWNSPAAMHFSHSFLKLLRQLGQASPEKKKVVPIKGLKGGKRPSKSQTGQRCSKLRCRGKASGRKTRLQPLRSINS
jgi:hypothetical protein